MRSAKHFIEVIERLNFLEDELRSKRLLRIFFHKSIPETVGLYPNIVPLLALKGNDHEQLTKNCINSVIKAAKYNSYTTAEILAFMYSSIHMQ